MGLIRVLLALFVVFEHSNAFEIIKLPGGELAVKVFFIISGFYMTLILSTKYVGRGSYSLFISNRFFEIIPNILGHSCVYTIFFIWVLSDFWELDASCSLCCI